MLPFVLPSVLPFVLGMVVLVLVLLYVHHQQRWTWEWVAKPLAVACFVAPPLVLGDGLQGHEVTLVVGLGLAGVGDLFLIPKSRRAFLAGLFAFLAGHLAYGIAFVQRGVDATWALGSSAGVLVFFALVLRWLWPRVDAPMRGPVAAYIVVIAAMVVLAFGTYGHAADEALLAGAVGFCLSDISIAQDRFVERRFVNRLWGLPLYFFSQLLLAWSVTRG